MMQWARGTNRLLAIPLLLLTVALVVIGTLQYRWLGRVAAAQRRELRSDLQFATQRLASDVANELHTVFRSFLAAENDDVASLLKDWRRSATHPSLVAAVYSADRDGEWWTLRRLDEHTGELAGVPWPPALLPLRPRLGEITERGPAQYFPRPMFGAIPALFIVQLPGSRDAEMTFAKPFRVLIVQLDRTALGALVRARAERVFPSPAIDVTLTTGDGAVLYRSSAAPMPAADIVHRFFPIPPRRQRVLPPGEKERAPSAEMWQLSVRYHDGIEAVIEAAHRRNLAVAFLALLVLAGSGVLLIVLLRREERLRRQQAQFVASMSHELNTPLAVLRVASENLQDGIVDDPEKVTRYVRTIARETTHLSEMVHHVLEPAGMRSGASATAREPVDVRAVVEDAVAHARWLPDASALEIELDVERDLPEVRGDAQALTRAVQNVLTNAIRHAGAGRWVRVRASRAGAFVAIAVEDRGPGIDPSEAAHLFDPFFRGRASSGVRGTGLGLTIVRQIVEDHGGTVRVESLAEGGARFVLRLPLGGAHA